MRFMRKKKSKVIFVMAAILFAFFGCYNYLFAYVMDSANYKIEADDSSAGGGNWSSVNYIFNDTVGEVSSGRANSASYKLRAGYQEMLESYISVSAPDDIDLSPAIPGISGGTGDGSVTWTVTADNSAGFNMKIKASTDPAMMLEAGYYFSDYTPVSGGTPDYNWGVGSGSAEFGFTVEPETHADTVQLFKNNIDETPSCNSGIWNTDDACWLDFNGTTDVDIINRTTRTSAAGEDEVVKFRAQSNNKFLKEGEYTATITTVVAAN